MGLREQAMADATAIVEDHLTGFGQPITLTAPDGSSTTVHGLTGEISAVIDPETGLLVRGRSAYAIVRITSLPPGARPVGVRDEAGKPWLASFGRATTGAVQHYKIVTTQPDDSLGDLVMELEPYAV